MTGNANLTDRSIRIILGAILIGWAIMYPDMPYSWIGWVGVIPFVTGLVGWCALYQLLGISTLQKD